MQAGTYSVKVSSVSFDKPMASGRLEVWNGEGNEEPLQGSLDLGQNIELLPSGRLDYIEYKNEILVCGIRNVGFTMLGFGHPIIGVFVGGVTRSGAVGTDLFGVATFEKA